MEYDLFARDIVGLSSRKYESEAYRNFLQNESAGEYYIPKKKSAWSKDLKSRGNSSSRVYSKFNLYNTWAVNLHAEKYKTSIVHNTNTSNRLSLPHSLNNVTRSRDRDRIYSSYQIPSSLYPGELIPLNRQNIFHWRTQLQTLFFNLLIIVLIIPHQLVMLMNYSIGWSQIIIEKFICIRGT